MKTLLITILFMLSLGLTAQPFIGLGMSKTRIENQMHGAEGWRLIHKNPSQLVYSDGVTTFTYEFMKDSPCGLNRTCVRCIVDFTTSDALNQYVESKLSESRFKANPDNLNMILKTDMFNDTIFVVATGKRLIFSQQ